MVSEADYRLPRSVVPSHYDIRIEPDLDNAVFTGAVRIDVEIVEPTSTIVMNAIELDVLSASVRTKGRTLDASVALDDATERLTLTFAEVLDVGDAIVEIEFSGILNDRLHGFYRSTYTDDSGATKVIATTQFEATDARRAFPCWDEPDCKATFSVHLVVDDDLMALSNAAEVARTPAGPGKVEVSFAETMKMSTYLVAFVVGDFAATEPIDVDGTPLRIVAPPNLMGLTSYALEAGAHALRYFSTYYDIPYPGDKLDMVAIPDFAWGAMENLGCITYRETALLVDPETATRAEKSRVASVIAHEIAHMWFGDLVTMKWWNGIWLNEAFATFAENKCLDDFMPQWDVWLEFAASRAVSQETDALASTRSVEMAVASPAEANAMFDVLTYEKGSSVLRMLEAYLGEDAFRAGVTRYLKTHEYANTETADLWRALEAESGQPVGEIMDTWIYQGGYPRVTVEAVDGSVALTQEPFRFLGDGDGAWAIPIVYRTDGVVGKTLMDGASLTLETGGPVIVNAGGDGFYRTRYVDSLSRSVLEGFSGLNAADRYTILSDAKANLLKGDMSGADYCALAARLDGEADKDVWSVGLSGLGELDRVISSDDRQLLESFVADLVSPAVTRLGWEPRPGESDRTRSMRGMLLAALGNMGEDAETIAMAREMFAGPGDVDPEVADAVLAIVAAHGDMATFDELIAASHDALVPQQKIKYLRAATQVPDRAAAERMFHMVLDGDIRSQDSFWVAALLLGHRENGPRVWDLITQHWDAILAAMPPQNADRMLVRLPYRSEPDVAAAIEEWFEDHQIPGGEAYTRQRVELMRVRVGLREREATSLGAALGRP